jgi:hypothetical protein
LTKPIYFHLNNPEHLAKRIVEKAKGASTTQTEIRNLVEWFLATLDPAHRLELVAHDIRIDKHGVDFELMSVPWYAKIHKDTTAIHACCSYGKHYEELVQNAKHLGQRWYAMVKFCETKFAESKLLVYKIFEKNYKSYRTT